MIPTCSHHSGPEHVEFFADVFDGVTAERELGPLAPRILHRQQRPSLLPNMRRTHARFIQRIHAITSSATLRRRRRRRCCFCSRRLNNLHRRRLCRRRRVLRSADAAHASLAVGAVGGLCSAVCAAGVDRQHRGPRHVGECRRVAPRAVRDPLVALLEPVGRHLWLPLPREKALLIAVDARHALRCHEVAEGPNLLSDEDAHAAQLVKRRKVLGDVLGLELLGEGVRRVGVQAGHRVGAVLRDHNRLAESPVPRDEISFNGWLDDVDLPRVCVPCVIPVDHQHVDKRRDHVLVGALERREGDRPGWVERARVRGDVLEVGRRRRRLRVGFVGDGPHDDARMVLIAADELGQHLHVTHQRLAHHVVSLQPDGWRFVDDDDA
mmetsp:Transcript_15107/g.32092  ORF Transcript_15107/g.32092 Transcript_15107/m.32092 type:complete len:380 (-) Transcript_15107:2039-3178(-)